MNVQFVLPANMQIRRGLEGVQHATLTIPRLMVQPQKVSAFANVLLVDTRHLAQKMSAVYASEENIVPRWLTSALLVLPEKYLSPTPQTARFAFLENFKRSLTALSAICAHKTRTPQPTGPPLARHVRQSRKRQEQTRPLATPRA